MDGVCFNIDAAVEFINKKGYTKIGLQFPSDLLIYSLDIYDEFKRRTSASVVILGDTPYSNCCVDELAGKRWNVEAVIHFGNACLTKSNGSVDVFYVFGDAHCEVIVNNLPKVTSQIKQQLSDFDGSILFFYNFQYRKVAGLLRDALKSNGLDVIFTEPALPNSILSEDSSIVCHLGRIYNRKDKSDASKCLLYLGECDSSFYSILVSMKDAYAISPLVIDPKSGEVNPATQSAYKYLKRRYFLMEKAKSAKRIGLLMGSLSISRYMDVVDRIKRLLKRAKIPYTTLVVGRLNEPKLMNIPNIGALVLVACPQASLYDDRNMSIPVITPFELECMLYERCKYEDEDQVEEEDSYSNKRQWNGLWLPLDFAASILNPREFSGYFCVYFFILDEFYM